MGYLRVGTQWRIQLWPCAGGWYAWNGGGYDQRHHDSHHQHTSWVSTAGWNHNQWGGAAWTQEGGGQDSGTRVLEGREAITTGSADAWGSDEERIRAEQAYALQQAAMGATGGAGFATAGAAAAAEQVHTIRIAGVKKMADDNGVSYGHLDFDNMSPKEVEEFAQSFLK